MKTIGLIGGIGWASTAEYYRLINESVGARLGDAHSAKIILLSLDQYDFTSRAAQDERAAILDFLVGEAARLKAAGADFFLFCANGVHRFADDLIPRIGMPFISIVEATAQRVQASGLKAVGLLGVKQTMAGRFYHDRLESCGVATLTPAERDQDLIHQIIYTELVHNRLSDASRAVFVRVIKELENAGAGGVILGCTEIPLLIGQHDVDIPIFNTTEIHCEAAVEFALR
ncbi:aspartate/glutamate racemase family protein [Janthinobacterium fluminis]|uniref:Amino acid racemase n=1 Tax=Janthinobacterium fluminis TaxID=2987524 RepID=A0ABT5JUD0_9BURK|nr:amino acid racemase [Janthinobacterium fluminis]MDC8756332.1 amino acid racemase [Janthinobacterium fluminis]